MAELEQAPEPQIYKNPKQPPIINRVLQRGKPPTVSPEDTSQKTLTRREALRFGGTLAKLGIAYGVLQAMNHLHVDKFLNPEFQGQGDDINKKEVHLLYLLDEPNNQSNDDGIKVLAKDLAIAAMGKKKDTQKPVDFLDSSTWRDYSDLYIIAEAFNNLFKDVATTEGRGKLKQNILNYEGENKEYYFLRLKKLEDYLQKKQLSSSLSEDDLRTFFSAPSEEGGLGYLREDTAFVFDLLKASRANQFTPELKVRINQINEKSGTRFRIP